MRASLAATVEVRGDATVVHVAGSLGVSTAPVLRTTVLECLATEPALIVLDVAELRAHEDVALTVLPALAQHAAAWPGSAVSMAAAPAPLRSALDRMAVARQIPLFATTDAAIAHGGAGAPGGEPPGMRARLQPMVDATAAARHLVDRACRLWGSRGSPTSPSSSSPSWSATACGTRGPSWRSGSGCAASSCTCRCATAARSSRCAARPATPSRRAVAGCS